jgi:hypothetical protein
MYQNRLRLRKEGRRYRGLCPFHDDAHANNFDVFQHEETWVFKCLSCGASGSILDLIQKTDSVDLGAAVVKVRQFCSEFVGLRDPVDKVFNNTAPVEAKSDKKYSLAEYKKWEDALAHSLVAQEWLLQERGLSYETAQKLHWGYTQVAGDGPVRDQGWIVFPSIENNEVVSMKYRSIVAKEFTCAGGMKTALHGQETIDPFEPLLVCEGEIDRGVLEQADFRCVSLSTGAKSNVTAEMKDQMLAADCVVLAGDTDEPGEKAMSKLWLEMQERTFMLKWPSPHKDANEFFLKGCNRDIPKFRTEVLQMIQEAKTTPVPYVYNLAESMKSNQRTNMSDHPLRLRMPWPLVDKMAVLLPGSVMAITATNTKQGKTQFCTQLSLYAARYHNETVINYQAELDIDEFSNIVASHVLKKSRNSVAAEDYQAAAKELEGVKYYVGRNPTLTTIGPVIDLLEAAIRRLGGTLCIIDHIHFLCRNTDDETQTQADAMQRIKNLAVKYGCKIIVVSQPRKAPSNSKGKVLHITDIKGSETLTSYADAVFALHRDVVKNKTEETRDEYSPETEVHLLGVRTKGDGTAMTKLYFLGDICTFKEMAYDRVAEETPQEESIF